MKDKSKQFILWFNETGIDDVWLVGGKNASLGEMYQNLTRKKVNIPNGFSITAYAYRYLLEKSGIKAEIKKILKGLNTRNIDNLSKRGDKHTPSQMHKVSIHRILILHTPFKSERTRHPLPSKKRFSHTSPQDYSFTDSGKQHTIKYPYRTEQLHPVSTYRMAVPHHHTFAHTRYYPA